MHLKANSNGGVSNMILQTNQFEDAVPKVNVMSEDDENRSSTSSMVTKANKLLAQKL